MGSAKDVTIRGGHGYEVWGWKIVMGAWDWDMVLQRMGMGYGHGDGDGYQCTLYFS